MTKPKRIELTSEELEALLKRVESGNLQAGDYEVIKSMAETIAYLGHVADQKGIQVARLLRSLFGSTSEKRETILSEDESNPTDPGGSESSEESESKDSKKKPKGHGRRRAADYTGAETHEVKHAELKAGADCPECEDGTLYQQPPSVVVRVKAGPPIAARVYEIERLRCGLCGATFTAAPPADLGSKKYEESVGSLIALLKYGAGMPFYRLQRLQESLGVPLPCSTQWGILDELKKLIEPAYEELFRQGAQGNVIYNDDTTARILELMGKRLKKMHDPPERTGLYTTGIISEAEGRKIALYFSANRHAGENLAKLLELRDAGLAPPIQMADGLEHNRLEGTNTILSNCLAHGRRRFLDLFENFPEEVRHLIDVLAEVYKTDEAARKQQLDAGARLELHQRESAPRMEELKLWLDELLEGKQVEPNSQLGQAITYVTKRWEPLTLFLRKPGAPLDNNIAERALKKAILNRKNSLFFKTRYGAEVGDLFLSLIHTAELCGANPFEYLNALQRNSAAVRAKPAAWMPWNYRSALEGSGESEAEKTLS